MIKKFLIFAILLISQKLIICADECSVFSCSNLSPAETGQTCTYTDPSCESKSIFTSCDGLSQTDCKSDNKNIKLESPTQECYWNTEANDGAKCELKQLKCSDYIDKAPPVECESLEASTGYCITDTTTYCVEESGCKTATTDCTNHKPLLDSNHRWDHSKKCVDPATAGGNCDEKPKLCTEFTTGDDGDVCTKLSTSDNTKKKCFLESDSSCDEQFVKCEYYTGDNSDACEAISNYIEDKDKYKCEFDDKKTENKCSKIRKECSDFDEDEEKCNNYKPEDPKKICFFTAKKGETTKKCIELTKIPTKCADLKDLADINDDTHCIAIKEDSYSECAWDTGKAECVKKPNECELDTHDSSNCDHILINKTHECKYIEDSCVEVKYYSNCNLYTGTERAICEFINPPESNKRCILLNDKQCVSVPKECEDYEDDSEYECINNYKPLDENYKCVFTGGRCTKVLKQKEYCYQGDESQTICEAIIPKNNGENYSIKCKFEDSKCVRVEKPCEDYQGTNLNSEICSSIIPKDQNKKCILRNGECVEEYKTCKAYNDDANDKEEDIDEETCKSIISNDGKKCKYTAAEGKSKATCKSDITNICDDTFIDTAVSLSSACASIKLSDISKKCYFENGECSSKSKSCLELVFNGNEEGIENMCKSAKTSDDDEKKCIISSDKKRCLEVDKDLVIEDEPSGPGGNGNTNDSTNGNGSNQPEGSKGTEGDKGTEGTDESKPNSGKTIYLNSLIGMILFLLL